MSNFWVFKGEKNEDGGEFSGFEWSKE